MEKETKLSHKETEAEKSSGNLNSGYKPVSFQANTKRLITGKTFIECGVKVNEEFMSNRVRMDFIQGVTVALNPEQLKLCRNAVKNQHLTER